MSLDWISSWQVTPPPGLTGTGRIRAFQRRTEQRLSAKAAELAEKAYADLLAGVESTYTEGEGTLAGTLQYRITSSRRGGVQVQFTAGTNHVVFLTALAGEPKMSPGHWIHARNAPKLKFYWKNPTQGDPPGVYAFRDVFWEPRQKRDIMREVLGRHAEIFAKTMVREHNLALVDFVQNELQITSRSTRVSTQPGSGIPRQ